jgi:hypothetical protein
VAIVRLAAEFDQLGRIISPFVRHVKINIRYLFAHKNTRRIERICIDLIFWATLHP